MLKFVIKLFLFNRRLFHYPRRASKRKNSTGENDYAGEDYSPYTGESKAILETLQTAEFAFQNSQAV